MTAYAAISHLSIGRHEFSKAVEYFEQALPELENLQSDARDPIGYADFVDDYTLAFEKAGKDEATQIHHMRARAKELRNTFPEAKAFSEKTPYGTQCQKNEHKTIQNVQP